MPSNIVIMKMYHLRNNFQQLFIEQLVTPTSQDEATFPKIISMIQ